MRNKIRCLFMITALLAIDMASAQSKVEMPDIHVQATQSFIYTSNDTDYLIDNSSDGSFQWTDFLINATKEFGNLRVGGQLLERSFGDDFESSLDWGYGDYRVTDELGIRAGKVKLPVGFFNEYRDVEMGRTSILLDQAMYPEARRDLTNAYQGIGLYGALGPVDYQAYYGTISIPDDMREVEMLQSGFNSEPLSASTDYIAGGQLVWNTPAQGLKMQFSGYSWEGKVPIDGSVSMPMGDQSMVIPVAGDVDAANYKWSVGLQYEIAGYTIVSEGGGTNGFFNYRFGPDMPLPTSRTNVLNWYITVDKEVYDKLTAQVGFHRAWENEAEDTSDKPFYQNTVSLALRYDVMDNWIVKAECNINSGTLLAENPVSGSEDWTTFMARLAFVF